MITRAASTIHGLSLPNAVAAMATDAAMTGAGALFTAPTAQATQSVTRAAGTGSEFLLSF